MVRRGAGIHIGGIAIDAAEGEKILADIIGREAQFDGERS